MSDFKLQAYRVIAGVQKPKNLIQAVYARIIKWLGIIRPSVMLIALSYIDDYPKSETECIFCMNRWYCKYGETGKCERVKEVNNHES